MSIYSKWLPATILINGTSSAEVDLGRGGDKPFDFLIIQIPPMTSCTLKVQVAESLTGTYRDLGDGITTATTTGAFNDVWKLGGYQFIKIVSSVNQEAERLIRVRGMRF